jgi:hypothetical protein
LGSGGARDSERLGGVDKGFVKAFLIPILLTTAVEPLSFILLSWVMNCIAPISWDGILVKDNYNNRMEIIEVRVIYNGGEKWKFL